MTDRDRLRGVPLDVLLAQHGIALVLCPICRGPIVAHTPEQIAACEAEYSA